MLFYVELYFSGLRTCTNWYNYRGLKETMMGTIIIGASYPGDFLENHMKKVLGVI